jgi:hypothetical protein
MEVRRDRRAASAKVKGFCSAAKPWRFRANWATVRIAIKLAQSAWTYLRQKKAMTSRSAQTARKMLRQIAVVLAYSCPIAFRPGDHIAAGVGAEERHKILGRQVKPSTVSTHKYANSAVRSKQFSSL